MAKHRPFIPEPDYDTFVEHPRYGRRPRITGLNPEPYSDGVHLHWNATTYKELYAGFPNVDGDYLDKHGPIGPRRIPDTAIVADLERQTPATVPVTHYFDLACECCDCKRPFIFFAEEQKYWYEELGFGLHSDCIRCVDCRKRDRGIARHRETYERLFHVPNRSVEEHLHMADACLALIEGGVFPRRKTETVRMLFNLISKEASIDDEPRIADLRKRLLAAEDSP